MDPMMATIIMFGGNFAPRGWALCEGQLLPISQYSALFSLLGTTYGGDGRTTFGLPDLRGRVPMGAGRGAGLTPRQLGEKRGAETNTLNVTQLPSHTHTFNITNGTSVTDDGSSERLLAQQTRGGGDIPGIYSTGNAVESLHSTSIGNTGNNQPINNIQPYQVVNFIIALQGTYPSRS